MMNIKHRVLIVDDSKEDVHFIFNKLKQEYAVQIATTGEQAIEIASSDLKPDVILMDVEMPSMNGRQCCQTIKETPETSDIEVIFVSAHDTTEEKLAGYDAGGRDYLIKPVQTDELLKKIKLAIADKEQRCAIESEKVMAMQTAMAAISSAGEQGVVIEFMRRSFEVESIQELADLVVEITSKYGLESSVQVRSLEQTVEASSRLPIPPLEKEMLFRLKGVGRLKESGSRLILNFGSFTQLIKNMPDDEDKCGRLRDHLAILLEGAGARLQSIEMQKKLAKVVLDTKNTLSEIEIMHAEQKRTSMKIMDEVQAQQELLYLTYGLTEEQETRLSDVLKVGVSQAEANLEKGMLIDEKLCQIINDLEVFKQTDTDTKRVVGAEIDLF